MHKAAHAWVAACVTDLGPFGSVVEHGGRDVNGSVRHLFLAADYLSIDLKPGDGVDLVADAATWRPRSHVDAVDCVVCCEVYEHTASWPSLVKAAYESLVDGGTFICTAAGPGRAPHSAVDGGHLRPGEWYANVNPDHLRTVLSEAGFGWLEVDVHGDDVRAVAGR